MLSLDGIAQRLHCHNHEACNRPGIWLSTLAASLSHGLRVLDYGEAAPEKTGRPQIAGTVTEELLEACAALDHTQRRQADDLDTTEALLQLLQYANAEGLALYGGGLYLASIQFLEAGPA